MQHSTTSVYSLPVCNPSVHSMSIQYSTISVYSISVCNPSVWPYSACTIRPPVRCSSSIYLKLLPIVCPAIRVWYVSRPNTLKSWISEKIIVAFLRSRAFHTHFSRAGIMGIWRGIEFFIWRYPHWVKSEANIPKRLGILRAPIYLVSF